MSDWDFLHDMYDEGYREPLFVDFRPGTLPQRKNGVSPVRVKPRVKPGSDTIMILPRPAHPFGCGTPLPQRLDLLPEPLAQRPALVRALANLRQIRPGDGRPGQQRGRTRYLSRVTPL